jgi:hypothetical protein
MLTASAQGTRAPQLVAIPTEPLRVRNWILEDSSGQSQLWMRRLPPAQTGEVQGGLWEQRKVESRERYHSKLCNQLLYVVTTIYRGTRLPWLNEALCYMPVGRGFDSQ